MRRVPRARKCTDWNPLLRQRPDRKATRAIEANRVNRDGQVTRDRRVTAVRSVIVDTRVRKDFPDSQDLGGVMETLDR